MNWVRRNVIRLSLGVVTLALIATIVIAGLTQTTPKASAAPAAQATATTAAPNPATPAANKGQQALDSFTKTFATKLNVDEAKLNSAFSEAVSDTVDQLVKDGTLNQTQADLIKAQTKNGFKNLLNLPDLSKLSAAKRAGMNPMANLGNFQEMGQYLMPIVTAVSNSLNLSPMEIVSQLQADKSLADIAKAQQVDLQKVKDAITGSIKTQLDAAVKAGKMTQAQADKANQTVNLWVDDAVNFHKSAVPANGNPQDLKQYFTPVLNSVASTLNLTPDQLEKELHSGKSLGDIARAQQVDLQKVKDAITGSAKTQLDAAAKAGKFTQAQADKAYQTLTLWIDELVK